MTLGSSVLPALPLFLLAACSSGGDASNVSADDSEALVTNPAARIRVVQCNIEDGGQFTNGNDSGGVTYDTAKRFAALMASGSLDGAAVIGMEEIWNDDTPRALLQTATKHPWAMRNYPQGIKGTGSGIAILWRTDLVSMVEDFGTVDVATLDNGYIVRFGGALMEKLGTHRTFGFFTGKLTWDGDSINGVATNDDLRADQADLLQTFIAQKMAPYPDSSRIVTMDQNGDYGTAVWDAMNRDFYDSEVSDATHDSHYDLLFGKRYDYIWWDYDGGKRRANGFYERPHRSEAFGSDHRFVWADVFLKDTPQ